MHFDRLSAILHQLRLDLREQNARHKERRALRVLGRAAALTGSPDDYNVLELVTGVRQGQHSVDALSRETTASLEADRADYIASAAWMRPVVVLRGLCTRAVLRHRIMLERRALGTPEEAIGTVAANQPLAFARHPDQVKSVVDARAELRRLLEERERLLEPFGGSALPNWFPHLHRESTVLGRALWLQFKPNVLPRGSALAGLAVGWWLANTYTDSQFRSVLQSLGIGGGGKRVVSGDSYKAMMFWLPMLGAAVFAYLADRAHFLVQRRYSRTTPPA